MKPQIEIIYLQMDNNEIAAGICAWQSQITRREQEWTRMQESHRNSLRLEKNKFRRTIANQAKGDESLVFWEEEIFEEQ